MKNVFVLALIVTCLSASAQKQNPANDPEASGLLQKASEKYKAYKNISANFKLITQRPKLKPTDDEKKFADTLTGQILLEGGKFKVSMKEQELVCDGKTLWTYSAAEKEVQINAYEETDDVFTPSKIFVLYKQGYLYQIKEKKTVAGKNLVVIEMAPPNKKVSYFKIDITIDEASLHVLESKVYEKNGTRYIYMLTKQTPNVASTADTFTFDVKKHPGVKVDDLR